MKPKLHACIGMRNCGGVWSQAHSLPGGEYLTFDYYVSFTPEEASNRAAYYNYVKMDPGPLDREGICVFYKDNDGAVFHTYSCFARGIDMTNATYQYHDLVPKGRDEGGLPDPQAWVRHHDRYDED